MRRARARSGTDALFWPIGRPKRPFADVLHRALDEEAAVSHALRAIRIARRSSRRDIAEPVFFADQVSTGTSRSRKKLVGFGFIIVRIGAPRSHPQCSAQIDQQRRDPSLGLGIVRGGDVRTSSSIKSLCCTRDVQTSGRSPVAVARRTAVVAIFVVSLPALVGDADACSRSSPRAIAQEPSLLLVVPLAQHRPMM